MKSLRDSCCRKRFHVEWMWSLVTNRQQIKRFGVTALLLLRHCGHQVAPELQLHKYAVCLNQLECVFCSSSDLVPFLFFSFFLFFFFIISTLFSSSAFLLSVLIVSLFSQTTSCSTSHPPSLFRSPFLSCSPDSVHMRRFFKSSGESHCGKFPARRLICGSLVSQHRCWGSVSMTLVFHTTAA